MKNTNYIFSLSHFCGLLVLFFTLNACSSQPSQVLEEDVTTVSFQLAADSCECKGWNRVKSDPTQVTCEDECYQLLPANDSVRLNMDSLKGLCIDFTGNLYKEKQPFGADGELHKTFLYTSYKVISGAAASVDDEDAGLAVLPFEKIDTNNFFRTFVAYVQNGNIYDMLFFYDSAYVNRHCVNALGNDTARCMNEQYCGAVLKGIEKSEANTCIDFTEIEKIEFLKTGFESGNRIAYFKIAAFDGRIIETAWRFVVSRKNKKVLFGFVGEED